MVSLPDGGRSLARGPSAVLLALLLLSLAGCADFQPLEEEARVVIVNEGDEPHQVLVEVTRDGTAVVREARAIRPDDSWSLAIPLERVSYELHVSSDAGGTTSQAFEVPVAGDEDNYVRVTIAPDGSLTSRVFGPS